jgi:hypothetical protein
VTVTTRKLGLAAYMKMKGAQLLGIEGRYYQFDTDRVESSWETEYLNTESYRHDCELMGLRKMMGPRE